LYIEDSQRAFWILLCLACMYGFTDAPLLFQLALVHFLLDHTCAYKSVYDDNHLFWLDDSKSHLILTATVHVDDILLAGTVAMIGWIQAKLEERFGKLKRQELPFTHTGLEYEMVNPDCLFQHQTTFISKLKPLVISRERRSQSEELCTKSEHTEFRSVVCSCLWATITRQDVVSELTGLQSELQNPKVKHLSEVNSVVRRLHKGNDSHVARFGLYYWRLSLPIRVLGVTDASAANKKSNYAQEGKIVGITEDLLHSLAVDKTDYLMNSDDIACLGGKLHMVFGSGNISKRISHSTSHAETLSCAALIPLGQLVCMRLAEPELTIKHGRLTPIRLLQIQEDGICPVLYDHIVDCMDLWDLACGRKGVPQDKSQRLAVLAIREERRSLRIRRFFHVVTKWMLADILTKWQGHDSESLLELLSCGRWHLLGPVRVRHGFGTFQPASSVSPLGVPSSHLDS
jgi:hypothetical protein